MADYAPLIRPTSFGPAHSPTWSQAISKLERAGEYPVREFSEAIELFA